MREVTLVAWILEVMIVVSLVSVLVRRFCVPAYVYRAIGRAENRRVELARQSRIQRIMDRSAS